MTKSILKKRGQVWVETVIYTLIGLAIIGILLGATKPRIEEIKDKSLIEQSIESLNLIHEKVFEVTRGKGSRQILGLEISKGQFYIDGKTDSIYWILDTSYLYSEPGETISVGDVEITLEEENEIMNITLKTNYSSFNITYSGGDNIKFFEKGAVPYEISVENQGGEDKIVINFEEV
jgi:type II secretory pathway pseudopilin PulG